MDNQDFLELLQGTLHQLTLRVEAEVKAQCDAPLAPSTTYSAHSPYAEAWDAVRRKNREAYIFHKLDIRREAWDELLLALLEGVGE